MINKGYIGGIKPFRFVTHAILPLVYDDSLSYYEVVSKVVAKLNELIVADNNLAENTKDIVTDWIKNSEEGQTAIHDAIDEYVAEYSQTPAFIQTVREAVEGIEGFEQLIETIVEAWLISAEGVAILDGAVDDYLERYVKTEAFRESMKDVIDALGSIKKGVNLYIKQKENFDATSKMASISGSVLDDEYAGTVVSQVRCEAEDNAHGKVVMQAKNGARTREVVLDDDGLHIPVGTADDTPVTREEFNLAVEYGDIGVFMMTATGVEYDEDDETYEITLNKTVRQLSAAINLGKFPVINIGNYLTLPNDAVNQMFVFNKVYNDGGVYKYEFVNPNELFENVRSKLVISAVSNSANKAVVMKDDMPPFVCKFILDNPVTSDKTNAEILSAYESGRDIVSKIVISESDIRYLYTNKYSMVGTQKYLAFKTIPAISNGIFTYESITISNTFADPQHERVKEKNSFIVDVEYVGEDNYTTDVDFDEVYEAIENGANVLYRVLQDTNEYYLVNPVHAYSVTVEGETLKQINGTAYYDFIDHKYITINHTESGINVYIRTVEDAAPYIVKVPVSGIPSKSFADTLSAINNGKTVVFRVTSSTYVGLFTLYHVFEYSSTAIRAMALTTALADSVLTFDADGTISIV